MKQKVYKEFLKKNENTFIWIPEKQHKKTFRNENIININYPVYIYCN